MNKLFATSLLCPTLLRAKFTVFAHSFRSGAFVRCCYACIIMVCWSVIWTVRSAKSQPSPCFDLFVACIIPIACRSCVLCCKVRPCFVAELRHSILHHHRITQPYALGIVQRRKLNCRTIYNYWLFLFLNF